VKASAYRFLGFLPIPLLIIIVTLLHFIIKPSLFFEPAWLLPVTNTIFVTLAFLLVAYIALGNYLSTGRIQTLLLGCGVLGFGIAGAIAGLARSVPGAGPNLNVTIYNAGAFIGAAFHFAAALMLLAGISPEPGSKGRSRWAAFGYIGAAVLIGLISLAALEEMLPPFFVQGVGPTGLRQAVLGTSDMLFAFSFFVFLATYVRNREVFLYWYALALGLTSISLSGFFIQSAVGSPIGWAARLAQYVAGIYFLTAILTAVRSARTRNISFDSILASSLSPAEEKFRALAEDSPDIIHRFNKEMRHIYINRAGLDAYAKPLGSVTGKTLEEAGVSEPYCGYLRKAIQSVFDSGQPATVEGYQSSARGDRFYQSRCVPEYDVNGAVANVLVASRDLTARRNAEIALKESEQRFAATLGSIGDAVIATDTAGNVVFMNAVAEELTGWSLGDAPGTQVTEIFNIVNEHTGAAVESPVARVLREGTVVGLANHTILIRKDGTEVPIDDSGAPIRDTEGRIAGVVLVFRDIAERKRADKYLEESKAKLEAALASMTDAVFISDLEGRFIEFNDAFVTFHKFRKREDCLKTLSEYPDVIDVFLPDGKPAPLDMWAVPRALRGETATRAEYALRRKDTGETWVGSYSFGPIRDKDGRIVGSVVAARDITDRKRTEEALIKARDELELRVQERTADLEKERQRFYDVLDTLPAMICLLTPDHQVPFANRSFREKFGEPEGRRCYDFCFGNTEPCEFCESYEVLKTGRPHHWELTTPDGKTVVDAYDFPFTDLDGSPLILEMDLDITDYKRAGETLRVVSAYNRGLIEVSLDPLVTIDRDGKISDVNKATENVTGYSREVLIGTDFSDYFTDPSRAKAGYETVFRHGMVRDYELAIRHRDGHLTPVLYNASVYRQESGEIAGVFAAARDITEQRRLQDQLQQAHKMEAVGTLAGGIAHDFNNILAAILGFTEMAIEDVEDRPLVAKNLQKVMKSAMRARELVKQILTFSRKREYERAPLRVTPVIKETVQLLRASIPATIKISFSLSATSDTVLATPVEVQQVLMNLAANASIAMQEKGGTMEVSLTDIDMDGDTPGLREEYLQLMVKDTGVGMSPEVVKRIFEPFFTTREVGKGTGMGLAVVYGIVSDLKGTITVESEPGKGSTFRVLLPKAKVEAKEDGSTPTGTPGGKERILFVDDEEMIVEWGRTVLERLGYAVISTTDSGEALRAFSIDPSLFDLVVTDQAMPSMSGAEFASALLAARKDIPIILCTGHSETLTPEKAREIGVREYLIKPLSKQELAEAVRRTLDADGGE